MSSTGLWSVVEGQWRNAAVGWLLVAFFLLMVGAEALSGDLVWAGFTLVVAALSVVPAVAFRDPQAMLPWEVLALASLPVVGRALLMGQRIGGVTLSGRLSTYLAVAAVALIIAVELDAFTPVRMNYSFAVLFVVIATMAAAGVWAVVQWLADLYLGTSLLLDGRPEEVIEEVLMWDFVSATLAGLLAGVLFEFYFRRHGRLDTQIPEFAEDVE